MTALDRALASAGRGYAWLSRGGRSRARPLIAILALVTLSALSVLVVGLTPQPADITFEDLKNRRLPPMSSWLRLEGDLREAAGAPAGEYRYTLHDPTNAALVLTVIAAAPLPTGNTQVTGRLSGALGVPGTFDTIVADVPAEPPRRDPWLLFSLPAILALVVVMGGRVGYPVLRRERTRRTPPGAAPPPRLGRDEGSVAEWSGRIGSEIVALDEARRCTVAVVWDPDVCQVTVTDSVERLIAVRRESLKTRVRVCRTDGCRPGVEVHAPAADVTLVFETRAERDRLAASIE